MVSPHVISCFRRCVSSSQLLGCGSSLQSACSPRGQCQAVQLITRVPAASRRCHPDRAPRWAFTQPSIQVAILQCAPRCHRSVQSNFDAAYAGNRAPLPIFVHEPWLKVRATALSALHFESTAGWRRVEQPRSRASQSAGSSPLSPPCESSPWQRLCKSAQLCLLEGLCTSAAGCRRAPTWQT